MYYYNHWEIKNTCNVFWICPSSTLLLKPLPDTWPWLLPVSWPMGYPSKHRQPWGKLTLLPQEPLTAHSFSVRIRAWGIPAPSTLGNILACSCASNYSCYECAFTNLESMDAEENHPLLDLAIQPCYLLLTLNLWQIILLPQSSQFCDYRHEHWAVFENLNNSFVPS